MEKKQLKSLTTLFTLAGLVVTLQACSSDPASWDKKDSPWEQRRNQVVEAPSAEEYKLDLEMATEPSASDLSYQAESVESIVPEAEPAVIEEVTEEVPPVDIVDEPVVADASSLLDVPANYYTVQLMASNNVDRVFRFADQHSVTTQYITATIRDGVIWHVLLLGVYPDYSSAVAAKDEIAPVLSTQPWIRSVGSVQKLMQ